MKRFNLCLEYTLFLIIGVMSFSMAINVFCRFCLGFSISWADELSQSLMVWLTFLGAAIAVREGLHYSFNYIEQRLGGKCKKAFMMLNKSITLTVILLLFIGSVIVTAGVVSWDMPALEISRSWVYGASVVGCLFMLIYAVIDIVSHIKSH